MILRTGRRIGTERAFTLIELVLVMAILIVVLSMTGASLTTFFRGRALDAEARRFVALTRHAQNRATSEGMPILLWIDERAGRYGLEVENVESGTRPVLLREKPLEFSLGRDLTVKVQRPPLATSGLLDSRRVVQESGMRFTPDGYMDETNPDAVIFTEKGGESILVVPSRNRLNYEIGTNAFYSARR